MALEQLERGRRQEGDADDDQRLAHEPREGLLAPCRRPARPPDAPQQPLPEPFVRATQLLVSR